MVGPSFMGGSTAAYNFPYQPLSIVAICVPTSDFYAPSPYRYDLITQCWVESPAERYSFEEITEVVNALLGDVAGYIDFSAICNSVDVIAGKSASCSHGDMSAPQN